jgi:hypothetical protein
MPLSASATGLNTYLQKLWLRDSSGRVRQTEAVDRGPVSRLGFQPPGEREFRSCKMDLPNSGRPSIAESVDIE